MKARTLIGWTDKRKAEAVRLKALGLSYRAIGWQLGVTRSAVGAMFRRETRSSNPDRPARPHTPVNRHGANPRSKGSEILPSRTPFATDFTCPDFADDDAHLAALARVGRFPAISSRPHGRIAA